jgi:hypothetical protein
MPPTVRPRMLARTSRQQKLARIRREVYQGHKVIENYVGWEFFHPCEVKRQCDLLLQLDPHACPPVKASHYGEETAHVLGRLRVKHEVVCKL